MIDPLNPTAEGRRQIRGADHPRALLAELAAEDWGGARTERLQHDLLLLGWDVLRGLARKGRIGDLTTGPVPKARLSDQVLDVLRNDPGEREELILQVLETAVPGFVRTLQRGRYDPDRGASIETFFINRCGMDFQRTAIRWANGLQRRWAEMDRFQWAEVFPTVQQHQERERRYKMRSDVALLLSRLPTVQANILIKVALGYTHAEIASDLGLVSARAVEGQIRRARQEGWNLVRDGQLESVFTEDGIAVTGEREYDELPLDPSAGNGEYDTIFGIFESLS